MSNNAARVCALPEGMNFETWSNSIIEPMLERSRTANRTYVAEICNSLQKKM